MSDIKTADEWLAEPQYAGLVVMDPDGWDRSNYAESWAQAIDETEFKRRLFSSTCMWPKAIDDPRL